MPIKFNHYWTIIPSKIEEYEKFIIHKFIPGTNHLGIHTVAGWLVLVGAYSEIILESVCSDMDLIENALKDPKYKELTGKLLQLIKNYKTKVLMKSGKTDSYTMDIKEDTIKFNQMWNIRSDKKTEYDKYTIEEFFPCMEDLGVKIAQEWEVLIGDGPRIICEGRAEDVTNIIATCRANNFKKPNVN